MRATINLEFTDDELRQYVEDILRRGTLNFLNDTFAHISQMRINPSLLSALGQAVALGFSAATEKTQRPGPVPWHTTPCGDLVDLGPTAEESAPQAAQRCRRAEANQFTDGGWWCCRCTTHNGDQRPACRACGHERCDVVVTPPPAAPSEAEPPIPDNMS